MHEFRLIFQRRRRLLLRLSAMVALGLGTLVVALPRADAHGAGAEAASSFQPTARSVLLHPAPFSSAVFATFIAPTHR